MPSSLDALSTAAVELTAEQLDIAGAILPISPIPWMCLYYPWLCGFRI